MFRFLIIIFCMLSSIFAFEKPLDLSLSHENIGKSTLYFEDPTAHMTFDEIRLFAEDKFQPVEHEVDSHLFTSSAYWYKFEVINNEKNDLKRYILFPISWLDTINVKIIDDENFESSYEGGDTLNFHQRSMSHRGTNFEHYFKEGKSTVYVQVKTRDPFIVSISVVDKESLFISEIKESSYYSFIYGVILSMLLYNFFLYFSLKVKYHLYYVFYLGLFLISNVLYNGHAFRYLLSDYPEVQNLLTSSFLFLFPIAGLFFAKTFLDLKNNSLKLNGLTNLLIIIFFGLLVITFFLGYKVHVITALIAIALFGFYVTYLAFYSLLKGNKSARFFLLGTLSGLIGSLITDLTVLSVIPFHNIGFQAAEYGMVIDSILLSLAIADKIRISNKEKLIAQKEAKTDMLTNLLNRRAYYEITHKEIAKCERFDSDLSLILLDIDFFKHVNDNYGHAAGDLVLKKISKLMIDLLREYDYCFRLGGEEIACLLPQANLEQAIALAGRIRMAIENMTVEYESHVIRITASLGVVQYKKDEKEIEKLEKRADNALYLAKTEGRNRIVFA